MNPSPKINLSAMVKKKNTDKIAENKSTVEEKVEAQVIDSVFKSNEEKTEEKKSMMPKLSLASIKTTKSTIEIKEEIQKNTEEQHKDKKEELLEVLENETELKTDTINIDAEKTSIQDNEENNKNSAVNSEINTDENGELPKVSSETIEEIEKKINEKVEEEINKKMKKNADSENSETIEILDDKKELFGNYKSEFIEKENTIIEKVETEKKKFSERIRLPKTRVLLVIGLIIVTAGIIGALFKFDPENHSPRIYKDAIIKNFNNLNIKLPENEWVLEEKNIDGFIFQVYKQDKLLNGDNYKYKEIIYNSKTELDKVIDTELITLRQEKMDAELKRIEEENKVRIEAENNARINEEKVKVTKEKIKMILHVKYNELIKMYEQ